MKIMSAPKNNQLEINLQIAQKLLRTTSESILNTIHPLSEIFLRGLFVRCLSLISKVFHKIIEIKLNAHNISFISSPKISNYQNMV